SHKATSADVQTVLERAARLDQFMQRQTLTSSAQNDWAAVKANLDDLARAYNVTWDWTNVSSAAVPDEPAMAVITDSGSTNRSGYRISVARGGRVEVSSRNNLTSGYVPADLAERFFADLTAAMPLAQLPV